MSAVRQELNLTVADEDVADRLRWIAPSDIYQHGRRECWRIQRAVPLPSFAGAVPVYWNAVATFASWAMPRNIVRFELMEFRHRSLLPDIPTIGVFIAHENQVAVLGMAQHLKHLAERRT